MFTITNPGKSPQKVAPKLRSNPGQGYLGKPTHGASMTCCQSYAPNGAAIAQPTTIATTGAHCCHLGEANSLSAIRINRVVPARMGAATEGEPSGTSESLLSTTVIIVEASNMRTVPATNGLMTRRSQESREMNTNCINAEATIRLDSKAGPPAISAEIQMAMKADAETTLREYPDPNLQNRKVCSIEPIPQTARAEKKIQDR